MAMQLSDKGIAFLAAHEGIVPAPYRDSVGVLTYGIGHTKAAGMPDPSDMPRGMPDNLDLALRQVFNVFRHDLAKYEAGVNRAVKVPMQQHEFDAAVSFHYNTGAIGSASWVTALNAGNRAAAVKGIMNWTKPREIIGRRKAEQELFSTGDYGKTKATVWGVSGEKVVWKPVRTLQPAEIVALTRRGPIDTPAAMQPDTSTGWATLIARILAAIFPRKGA